MLVFHTFLSSARAKANIQESERKNTHTNCTSTAAEQESLTYSWSNPQTWTNTGAAPQPGYTQARENTHLRTSHLSSTSLRINPVHTAEGLLCTANTWDSQPSHTLLTWNTAVAILSQCVCVCESVCRSSLSLFGVFLCPPCLVLFFLFCFVFLLVLHRPFPSPPSLCSREAFPLRSVQMATATKKKKKKNPLSVTLVQRRAGGVYKCVCVRESERESKQERERESWCVCFRLQANRSGWSLPLSLLLLLLLLQENEHKNV